MRGWVGAVLALAGGAVIVAVPGLAEPLKLTEEHAVFLTCSTQSVVMLPAAAGSNGDIVLRLELKTGGAQRSGVWSVTEASDAHTSSFAARD
ncbi:MAG: hypothetical protein ACRETL_12400, partial [Gammaproteobacteria bacterium]